MAELTLNTKQWNHQAGRLLMGSKKQAKVFMEQRAAVFMRTAVAVTPPGDEKVQGAAAKKRGVEAIEGDLARLFIPWKKSGSKKVDLEGVGQLADHHRHSRRKSDGRVRKNPAVKNVWLADFNAHRKAAVKKVGSLAGGFNRAAAHFGVKPPAWIWRQSTGGAVEVRVSDRGIRVRITNMKRFAAETRNLESRLQRALNSHAQAMRRQADDFYKKVGRRSGWRVR